MTRGAEKWLAEPDPQRYSEAAELASRLAGRAAWSRVALGTAGWTDKTLIASRAFYPKGKETARERLAFYASVFSVVEVDATYYTLIAPEIADAWIAATEPGFSFDVKAHPILTGHPIDVRRLPRDLATALGDDAPARVYPHSLSPDFAAEIERRFFEPVQRLAVAGRLGAVLLQFPPWFTATRKNAQRIESIAERYPGVRFCVEFRHKSWLLPERRERVFDLLSRHRLSYVCVDEPAEVRQGGVPDVVAVTAPELAVVRFHGKNVAGWNKRGASVHERFDYLYSPTELKGWLEPIARLAGEAQRVHAIFNNCVRDYAVVNAKGLAALLQARGSGRESEV
jgi:uncharacterized protein YecE (DUF72 family)